MGPLFMFPDTPIDELTGIPKKTRQSLQALGIATVRGLIFYFPFRYDDFTRTSSIKDLPDDGAVTVDAEVVRVGARKSFRRRMSLTEAVLSDGQAKITALWFNQPHLSKTLKAGERYRFAGKVSVTKYGKRLIAPLFQAADAAGAGYAAPLIPVYSLPRGISQLAMRKAVKLCEPAAAEIKDQLPAGIRRKAGLIGSAKALSDMHFPASIADRDAAWRRIGFEELFRFHVAMAASRRQRQNHRAPVVPFDKEATQEFVAGLPFALTGDQKRAAWEALRDMQRPSPMHRLLDGDVGSGKTVVAAIAAVNVARAGFQTAVMAPTEILARQHYDTFSKLFVGLPIEVVLWTNSYKRICRGGKEMIAANKKEADLLLASIAEGGAAVIVGTHALIEDRLRFSALALAVIDEQHRFGVRTRQLLTGKSGIPGSEPHLLSMTATPIPRSLALTFFGDLDLSLLKEKPFGRKDVVTRIVPLSRQEDAYAHLRKEIAAGRQAFVVCPLIDPSDSLGVSSVTQETLSLGQGVLKGLSLGMLHGKMSSGEKESVMSEFASGRLQVLIATSVVEVGVNVPNATVMCILGAERYGLAQLHQFRGRIGRAEHSSYCFLMPTHDHAGASDRLRAVVTTSDGFTLAEKDLKMRGPGDMLGDMQSGFPQFRVASLADAALIKETKDAAEAALSSDSPEDEEAVLAEFFRGQPGRAHLE